LISVVTKVTDQYILFLVAMCLALVIGAEDWVFLLLEAVVLGGFDAVVGFW
jgi:hypothetical protein